MVGAVGLTVCVDGPTAPRPGESFRAYFNMAPTFPASASKATRALAEVGLPLDRVRVTIKRGEVFLVDTTVATHSGDSLALQLSVNARAGEALDAGMTFKSGETDLFEGTARVVAQPLNATLATAPPVQVETKYVGPGAKAKSVVVAPASGVFGVAEPIAFSARALDENDVDIPKTPFTWSVDDATLGAIDEEKGIFTPSGKRGAAVIVATTPGGLKGQAVAALTPPPSKIVVISGNGQTVAATKSAPQPLVVAVQADDNVGVPGQTVTFAATDSGSVSPVTVITDENGLAQTTLTVGAAARVYNFTARSGALSTTATATATVGAATTMTAVGQTSFTLVSGQVPTAASHVLLTDAGNNPVPNASVQVEVFSGATSLGSATVFSDATGRVILPASVSITAPAGIYTVRVSNATLTGSPITYTITVVAGPAARLLVKTPPSAIVQNDFSFPVQPSVQLADVNNNEVRQSGVSVSAGISAGGGILNGTTSVATDANGTASFSDLSLTGTAGARTLSFTASGLTSISTTVTVIGGSAVTMAAFGGDHQTATVKTAVAIAPSVKLVDRDGNAVSGVSVRFAIVAGAGEVGNSVVVSDADGIASSGSWTLGATAGTNMLRATAFDPDGNGIIVIGSTTGTLSVTEIAGNPVTFTATGTVGAPAKLGVKRAPSATAGSRSVFAIQPQIGVLDAYNNPVTQTGVVINVAIQSGGGSLDGVTSATTDAFGLATFTNLSIAGTSGLRTLAFSASGLTSATSNVNIVSGSAISMTVNAGDGQTGTVGTLLPTVPSVRVVDRDGNGVGGINVRFAVTGGGGTVTGANAVTDASGIAAPSAWRLGSVAAQNTLSATAYDPNGGPIIIIGGSDGTIEVDQIDGNPALFRATATADAAAQLRYIAPIPTTVRNRMPLPVAPVIQVADQFGNAVALAGVNVELSVSAGSATLEGTTIVTTDAQGRATFSSVTVAGSGNISVGFSAPALGSIFGNVFVGGGLPAAIVMVAGADQSAPAGQILPVDPAIRVVDGDGIGVQGVQVKWAIIGGGGGVVVPAPRTDASGFQSVQWSLGVTGPNQLRATAVDSATGPVGIVGSTDGTIAIAGMEGNPVVFTATGTAMQPTAMVAFSAVTQSGSAGQPVAAAPAVRVTDAANNPVPGVLVGFAVTSGSGAISHSVVTTNANGVAQLLYWTLGPIGGTHTVAARAITSSTSGVGVTASTAGTVDVSRIAGSTLVFTAEVAPAAVTWIGGDPANPQEWNLSTNWSPAQIPGPSDTAVVGVQANQPVVNGSNVNLGGLRIASGATVVSMVAMNVATPVQGQGTLALNGGGSVLGGAFDVLSIGGGNLTLRFPTTANAVSVGGALSQANGTLNLGSGGKLTTQTLATTGRGSVRFFSSSDSVIVGDVSFGGKMTAFHGQSGGVYKVTGDFIASADSAFIATNIKVVFAGASTQTVAVARRNSFKDVAAASTAPVDTSVDTGVHFISIDDSVLTVNGSLSLESGQITVDGVVSPSVPQGTLVDVLGNLTLANGTGLRLNGYMRYGGTYTPNSAQITGPAGHAPYDRSTLP